VLFIERARAVAPGFRPTATIVEICRHVNGLPLAIELAAAHVALLDPDDLLARLEQRLPLLTSRSRDAPARQRTLRAAIEWSYELLELTEQDVFRRLAVFRGSFSLGAAEAICGADLDILESLVEKNLVRRWGSGRLGMLDTIGEYALERLDESPDAGAIHQRHGEFFLSLAESANLNAAKLDVRKPMRQDIANADQDNFRGAIAWAISSGSVGLGLKLASALEWFWVANDPAEGIRWFAGLLERPEAEAVQAEIRANALMGYGSSTDIAGHDEAAERLYEQSLALYQQLGDEHGRAVLLHRLGIQAMRRMELERARELVEASQAIHKRTGDRCGLTQTIGTLGAIARDTGDDTHAHELISQSAALARDVGVPWRESGMLAWWESGMLAELACLALNSGRIEEAEMRARDSLELAKQLEDRAGQVFGVGVSPASQSSAGSSSVPVTSRARSRMRTR
jgi:tetratricopeptide (TPR) repeat protein